MLIFGKLGLSIGHLSYVQFVNILNSVEVAIILYFRAKTQAHIFVLFLIDNGDIRQVLEC